MISRAESHSFYAAESCMPWLLTLKLLAAESVTCNLFALSPSFLITVRTQLRYKHWGGGNSFVFAGTVLCKYNRVVICLCGWKLFYLQALLLYSAWGLVARELFCIPFEKSVDNCQFHECFCDAVKVSGSWQRMNLEVWSVVTQWCLNTGSEARSTTA